MTLNAHAPVPSLLTSLRNAGWGDLSGAEWQGVRTTLDALASQLPHKAGQGLTTAPQVAMAAGLTERWVRRCMHVLESLGVIEWTRGGVVDGKPAPSYVRIVKRVLVDLIRAARPLKNAAEAARRTATNARLAALRRTYLKSSQPHSRRSAHAELSASPISQVEVPGGTTSRREDKNMPNWTIPLICPHDGNAGLLRNGQPRCPMCRREQQAAARTAAHRQERPDVRALAAADTDLFDADAVIDLAAHRRTRRS